MKTYTEQLYDWLPAIYRARDAERGGPLKALLEIIGEQGDLMDADIARLYDNQFIETCDKWLVPYIGDLLGVRGLHAVGGATFSQRARVANTLRYRRRKGTAAMLEQLARDTTGWNARVVEFFQLLGTTQHLNHLRPQNFRTPNLRDANALELLGTPFDAATRTADVRHIATGRGKHNLPSVGLFLWRLQAYPVNRAPAFAHGQGRFSFSQLGHDAPLFHRPVTEDDISHLANELNVPAPIRLRAFHEHPAAYYGGATGLLIWEDGTPKRPAQILPCDLTGWVRRPPAGQVAVDPVLGRLAFPEGVKPGKVEVRYAYGFSADIGGGFYDRDHAPEPRSTRRFAIAKGTARPTLAKAISDWTAAGRPDALFVIEDSECYEESLDLTLPAGHSLEIRAGLNAVGEQQRPVLCIKDAATITATPPIDAAVSGATLILDGLWIAGNQLKIQAGDLAALTLRHCTLVPGWSLKSNGVPTNDGEPSVSAHPKNSRLQVTLERCISGPLLLGEAEKLSVSDSFVVAGAALAIAAPVLAAERSTIFGRVKTEQIELASNSIFTGLVNAVRRQTGCVRFCSLPAESKVPSPYRCQPMLAIQQAHEAARAAGKPGPSAASVATIEARLRHVWASAKYGTPAFGRLHAQGPEELFTGADNEAEMGALNHLLQPQREANLRASLDEYLRAGLEAGVFFVD